MCLRDRDAPAHVYPVGRLDRNSEGLLLLTNDGAFANLVMHPSNHISKTYRVTVRPDVSDEQAAKMSAGVMLDGRMTLPATVLVLEKQDGRVVLQITIQEGRNRQVRRMCEAVGLEVARLKRTSVGPLKLCLLYTSAYDIESRLLEISDLTLLTITHNMSKDILELYDEIIFMADGKIIEHGTFETLIAKHAAFYDFYQLKK